MVHSIEHASSMWLTIGICCEVNAFKDKAKLQSGAHLTDRTLYLRSIKPKRTGDTTKAVGHKLDDVKEGLTATQGCQIYFLSRGQI